MIKYLIKFLFLMIKEKFLMIKEKLGSIYTTKLIFAKYPMTNFDTVDIFIIQNYPCPNYLNHSLSCVFLLSYAHNNLLTSLSLSLVFS